MSNRTGRGRAPALFAALLCLGLGACATAPDNPLTVEQRRDMGIAKVEVSLKPDARIWWGDAERDYARSQGCEPKTETGGSREVADRSRDDSAESDCDYSALVNSPEAEAYIKKRAVDVLRTYMEPVLMKSFEGPDPTVAVVEIESIFVVSAAQAILVGGSHTLTADFSVKDQIDGRVLARYDRLTTTSGYGPGGILAIAVEAASGDPYDRLTLAYAARAKEWLKGEK